jgi:V/A-type H+/Na+-transporting ATPase subunit E
MPEALQSLIDKLQGEVVDEAEAKARTILADAEAEAGRRIAAANAEANRIRSDAERDATLTRERGEEALKQASRDLLMAVRRGVEDVVMALVRQSLGEALTPETLRDMLLVMAEAYAKRSGPERRMSVLLGEEDREKLARFYADEYRQKLATGVDIRLGRDIDKGFRVSVSGDHVEHDFTLEAITSVLADMLRPELAKLLTEDGTSPGPDGAEAGARP